jgi:hypothetical protein
LAADAELPENWREGLAHEKPKPSDLQGKRV